MQPDDAETREFPADKHFVDCPTMLESASPDISRKSLCGMLIAALDDLSRDVSDDLVPSEIGKCMEYTHTMETELARPQVEDVLHLNSSQGTKPDTRPAYDLITDLSVGHVAVAKVALDN